MSKYIINYVVHRDGLPDVVVSPDVYYNDFKKRIQSMIGIVEQMCYTYEGGKDKSEWGNYMQEQFQNFRRKMLDIADEVAGIDKSMLIESIEDKKDTAEIEGIVSNMFKKRRA